MRLVQNLLGEKLLYQNINFVELAQINNDNEELIYLHDLQMYIDSINSKNQKQ